MDQLGESVFHLPGIEFKFKMADSSPLEVSPLIATPGSPRGIMYLLAVRRPSETDEEWASRCAMVTNIGHLGE